MKIGIDAKSLSKRYTGIAIYVHEMVRYLNDIASPTDDFYLFSNRDFKLDFTLRANFHKVIYHAPLGSMGVMFQIGRLISRLRLDLFWGTEHSIPLTPMHCKLVVTIHDLAVLRIPRIGGTYNTLLQRAFTTRCCRKADLVIAISKATAHDVHDIAGVPEERIKVIYNGDSPYNGKPSTLSPQESLAIREKFNLNSPYFLFVGTIEPRKNIPTIIKAFNHFSQYYPNHKLVLAGGLGWRYKASLNEIENSPFNENIILTGYCTSKEREFFYRNATALLYPSLYEGLGLPILEAMSVGTPVVTSNVSSMPEVGGDAALYINNVYDYESLSQHMANLSQLSPSERDSLSRKCMDHARKFSRKDCAVEIYETLKKLSSTIN